MSMANVSQKTLGWLWDVLRREYHDPNRTYSDLAQTLSRYPSLTPRTDVYTFENGAHALLVRILGTIPVNFRGTNYRYPVAIWVPHAYPYEAPIPYVTPTEDMIVRPGQHVAGDGRIYHHYLAHWRESWDRSNVDNLIALLSDIFAKEPPVMARQQSSRPQQPQPQPRPPPRPPLPDEPQRRPSQPQGPSQHGGPPPPPPKQFAIHDDRTPSPTQPRPGRYDAPPPLPAQPQPPDRRPSGYGQPPQGNGNIQQPSPSSQYLPQRVNSLRPGPPQQPQPQPQPNPAQILSPPGQPLPPGQQPSPHHMHHQYHQPAHHIVHPHPHHHSHPHPPNQHPPQPPPNQPQNPPQPSLLDSPFDISLPIAQNLPAPPIPRNPEKDALLSHLSSALTTSLHSQIAQNHSAILPLQSQNAALQSTLPRLQGELSSLSSLQETLKSNISLLQSSLTQSDTAIASARRRSSAGDIPKVDDMLVPPHVVGKQLYDTVAEERGIEAAIMALQEASVRGRVGSEVWGRRTRELAREGFRRRYLARKVGVGMGLET